MSRYLTRLLALWIAGSFFVPTIFASPAGNSPRPEYRPIPNTLRTCPEPDSAIAAKTAAAAEQVARLALGDNPLPRPAAGRIVAPGDNCENPLKVDLPFEPVMLTGLTTCGRGNDYDATCLGHYDNGEELIMELTVIYPGYYEITLDPEGTTYTGFLLTQSCPPDSNCVEMSTSSGSSPQMISCVFLENGVYYLMVDTWPAPDCIPSFSIEFQPMYCDIFNDYCDWPEPITNVVDYPFSTDWASFDGPGECMTSRNLWYLYTAPTDDYVTFSLCGSSYDTKLAVYDGADCATATLLDCNDDACGLQSELNLTVQASHEYLIEVGGYSNNSGEGVITISGGFDDPFICWPNTDSESEPCGDSLNDGCNLAVPVFDTIGCNDSICGTTWADYGSRDTDWYLFELTEPSEVTAYLYVDISMVVGLLQFDQIGVVDCDLSTGGLQPYATAAEWDPASISTVRPAGQYILFAAPADYMGAPCGTVSHDYGLILECEPYDSTSCEAGGGCDEHIVQVTVGAIDNESACEGYSDFTAISTDMQPGVDYPATIVSAGAYSGDDCAIWIDWDRDSLFYGANELIPLDVETGYGPFTGTITPPLGALPGPTRMRIRLSYYGSPETMDPCGITTYGEVEDYTVNITDNTAPTWRQDPDPFMVYHKYAIAPGYASLYLSNGIMADGDVAAWGNIAMQVDSCDVPLVHTQLWGSVGDLPGPVRQLTFVEKDLIECYESVIGGLVFDTAMVAFTIDYDVDGVPGQWSDEAVLRGHRTGDVNLDGAVNVADVALLVGYLFGGADLAEPGLADVDGGDDENISDLMWLVAYLFGGGPPPLHN